MAFLKEDIHFMKFIFGLLIFMAALFLPAFIIQFSVERLTDLKLDIFGIYTALLAMLCIKVLYFDKNE